jgi:hypothetical protein
LSDFRGIFDEKQIKDKSAQQAIFVVKVDWPILFLLQTGNVRRMKTVKLKFLAQVTFLLLLSVCTAQAATTLTVIGRHPFYKPPLKSVDDLRSMMRTQQDAVMEGLQKAGVPELYTPLMQQFPQAQIQNVEYQPGETFHWMLFRPNGVGQVKAAKDLTWGGKAALSGYEFFIDAGGNRYIFAVPLFCGNIALKEVVNIVVQEVPGPERIVEVPGPERIVEKIVEAAPQCCPPCIYPVRFVADMGYLRLSDPADFGFGRIGVEYAFNQRLSFLGMIGGAAKFDGNDGEDAWLVDFMLQYNMFFLQVGDAWNPVFAGFGLGGWMSDGNDDIDSEDSDIDIIAQIGAQIFGHPDSFNTSVFFEARSGIDETDKLSEYGRFGAGLRFRF